MSVPFCELEVAMAGTGAVTEGVEGVVSIGAGGLGRFGGARDSGRV